MDRNTLIFSLLFLFLVIYLFVELFIFLKRTSIVERKKKIAQINLVQANTEKALAKKVLLEEIAKEFDGDITQKVREGLIWPGMSELLLVASLGKAGDIKDFKYNNTDAEKWFYNGYRNLVGTMSYKREVILRNKIVIDFSDR